MSRLKTVGAFVGGCFLGTACAVVGGPTAAAEEAVIRAMSPWQGSGEVFEIGADKRLILGRFTGILYLDGAKGELDTGLMLCPAMINLDLKAKATNASGHCTINDGETDDRVFADWTCAGPTGSACEGDLTITGGSGRFEGISGGGRMTFRAALVETATDLDDGTVVRDAAGLAVWPEIKLVMPR